MVSDITAAGTLAVAALFQSALRFAVVSDKPHGFVGTYGRGFNPL